MLNRRTNAPRLLVIVAALWATPALAIAQQASLQGIVTSAATGGPVEGVAIVLETGGAQAYGALTDRNGFYQVGGIAAGTYTLRSRHIGFASHQQEVTFTAGERLTVSLRLDPEAVAVEGILVSPERGAAIRDLGRQRITPAELRLVPVPAGSGDLASYLQTLPGVVTTGDRGGQLFVRGGTPAENLVLVDGIPIFQPFHILGFFSVFPEDLVSSVDFYAGGFGARYEGRTSSVLDVRLRDGNPNAVRVAGSASPFLAEALVEGPAGPGVSWMASVRRSLVEETSEMLLGTRQPLTFESQLLKLTITEADDLRCSALAMRTSDRGRLDPDERESRVEWQNFLVGGRCVALFERILRLLEVNFSYSSVDNAAVSRGSSRLRSSLGRIQHDAHTTSMIGSIPLYGGYHMYADILDHDLTELYGVAHSDQSFFTMSGYLEAAVSVTERFELRPGVVLTSLPGFGVEPRLRASWEPFGRSTEKLQGAVGLYRQYLTGVSDMRDVSSVFLAWMPAPDDVSLEALQGMLGWQQSLGGGLHWSLDGYYKRLSAVPVPVWRAIALFTTRLERARGEVYGADTRVEYAGRRFYGFLGYGYGWTRYEVSQPEFATWFGDPVQRYHPPHDRRHQLNALASLELAGFQLSARWQLGTGLPFTRPLGFDEALDYRFDLHDPTSLLGIPRIILDRPFTGRLPAMHRLDLSLERRFELPRGRLTVQAGAINAYDRQNMFYYDLYTARRVDQLPLTPYAAVTMRGR